MMQSIVILYHPLVLICRYLENIPRLFSSVQETLVHHPYHRCKSFIFEGLSCWNILQDTNSCYPRNHKMKSIYKFLHYSITNQFFNTSSKFKFLIYSQIKKKKTFGVICKYYIQIKYLSKFLSTFNFKRI